MVLNSSSLAMNNPAGNEMRRSIKKELEEAGLCMPGAGLIYMVTERTFESFEGMEDDFSMKIGREKNTHFEKILARLNIRLCLLKLALLILDWLAFYLGPVVMEQLKVLTIPISTLGPLIVVVYIYKKLIGGAVYTKWKTLKRDQLDLVRRVNHARRELPSVFFIHADAVMIMDADSLNLRCCSMVRLADFSLKFFWFEYTLVILLGLTDCCLLLLFM